MLLLAFNYRNTAVVLASILAKVADGLHAHVRVFVLQHGEHRVIAFGVSVRVDVDL